jgi:hypothetical protein
MSSKCPLPNYQSIVTPLRQSCNDCHEIDGEAAGKGGASAAFGHATSVPFVVSTSAWFSSIDLSTPCVIDSNITCMKLFLLGPRRRIDVDKCLTQGGHTVAGAA